MEAERGRAGRGWVHGDRGRKGAGAVTAFLGWLQDSRHNSVPTRNQRLAAISSFCTWMQTEDPALGRTDAWGW